jgi:Ca2+-transporting ATPase
MKIDESWYTEDRNSVNKKVATEGNVAFTPDPFLLSNSFVLQGNAKAVVCVVGPDSRRGSHDEKLDTESKTPLQSRLDRLGAQATKLGIQASLVILGASLLNFCMGLIFHGVMPFDLMLNYFAEVITQFITVIIVAVPEGLPLTISLSLAYSVMRMKKDGILIKDLKSPEVMGSVNEILIGKTGTLTYGDLKVTDFYIQSKCIKN